VYTSCIIIIIIYLPRVSLRKSDTEGDKKGLTENGGPMKNNRCESNDRKMQDQLLGWKMQEQIITQSTTYNHWQMLKAAFAG